MIDIDPFLKDAVQRDTIPDFASPGDHFTTGGGLEFDFSDNPRRLRSGHVLDFKGATLELDVDRVTDEMLHSEMAIIMLGAVMGNLADKTGEDAFNAITTHTAVRNVRLVANYTKLAARAKALGVKQFAVAGVGLQGHDAQVDVVLSDFGAYGREGFPAFVVGVDNSFDSHPLYSIDPRHMFDEGTESSSLKYRFEDFNPVASRSIIDGREITHQVTVGMRCGALCPSKLVPSPWSIAGPWRHMMRRAGGTMKPDVVCPAGEHNAVQAATDYQSLGCTIDGKSQNASVLYYSDYYQSRGVRILPSCQCLGWSEYGVIVRLSPTAGFPPNDYPDLPPTFSAEDFVIEKFIRESKNNTDVFLNADLLPGVSKNPPTRYLRNIAVDERLTLSGNLEGYVKIPNPNSNRKGCARLNPFRKR